MQRWGGLLSVPVAIPALLAGGILSAVGVAAAIVLFVGSAHAGALADPDPIVGSWNFSGGVVRVTGGPSSFTGTVVKAIKASECTHPVGEVMWRIRKTGSTYTGTHAFFDTATCVPGSGGLGRASWSITENDQSLVLHFCATDPKKPDRRPCVDLTRPKSVEPPATLGWLELDVILWPAAAKSDQQFRICLKRLDRPKTLCWPVTSSEPVLVMNHGEKVVFPIGTQIRVCGDGEYTGWITPACRIITIREGLNRARMLIRQDMPPQVKAFSKGLTRPGTREPLEMSVKDDSGQATLHVTLYEGGTTIKQKAFPVKATGQRGQLNTLFAADLVGPLYFCVWAEDAAGNRSAGAPKSSCAWIKLLAPIDRVSNGCGGGVAKWDVGVIVQNYFGNRHTYHDFGTGHKYTVDFEDACNLHDAGYGGHVVKDGIRGGITDFRNWSRSRVDSKFLRDLRYLCHKHAGRSGGIPGVAKSALEQCVGGTAYYALALHHLIGAETLYGFVRQFGSRFFDFDLTKPGHQGPAEKRGGRDKLD